VKNSAKVFETVFSNGLLRRKWYEKPLCLGNDIQDMVIFTMQD